MVGSSVFTPHTYEWIAKIFDRILTSDGYSLVPVMRVCNALDLDLEEQLDVMRGSEWATLYSVQDANGNIVPCVEYPDLGMWALCIPLDAVDKSRQPLLQLLQVWAYCAMCEGIKDNDVVGVVH